MKALSIQNVSKVYRLGEIGTGTLSHDLNRWVSKLRGKEDPFSLVIESNNRERDRKDATIEYVYALKNLSLDVEQGEVVGVIGANGAGKSTLLKLISRITAPTSGVIKARGRIASLLEVGTGMHPEMTAEENVYLNGSILGMRKKEIDLQIEDILDFAGCKLYRDTPVKRFSSGMRVRLGFAVAAFLEPEILIVDEVLAVGDAEFQKKAVGKIKEVSQTGNRTVLFVSHNMGSILSLCTRCILIEQGELVLDGTPKEVVDHYKSSRVKSDTNLLDRSDRKGTQLVKASRVETLDMNGVSNNVFFTGDSIKFKVGIQKDDAPGVPEKIFPSLVIKNEAGVRVTTLSASLSGVPVDVSAKNEFTITFLDLPLTKGFYKVDLMLYENARASGLLDALHDVSDFEIEHGSNIYGSGIEQGKGLDIFSSKFEME